MKNIYRKIYFLFHCGLSLIVCSKAVAGDVEIGTVKKNGMEITAVYIQPVPMDPMLPGMGMSRANVAFIRVAGAMLTRPRQFGPMTPTGGISF